MVWYDSRGEEDSTSLTLRPLCIGSLLGSTTCRSDSTLGRVGCTITPSLGNAVRATGYFHRSASLVVGDYRQSSWDSARLNYLPFDSLAQLVEQHTFNVKVRGSSPRRITILWGEVFLLVWSGMNVLYPTCGYSQ